LARHVARSGLEIPTKFWSETLMGRDDLEDLDVNGKVILE